MNELNILLIDDGSPVMKRYETLLSSHDHHVRRIPYNRFAVQLSRASEEIALVFVRGAGAAEKVGRNSGTSLTVLILAEEEEYLPGEEDRIYCALDDDSSDPVVLSAVRRGMIHYRFLAKQASLEPYPLSDSISAEEKGETYQEIINGMNESVLVLGLNGSILDVNRNAIELLGYSREEFREIGTSGIDNNIDFEEIRALFLSQPQSKIQVFDSVHVTRNGREIPVEISVSLILYYGSRAVLCIARDITNRKETEIILREQLKKDELVVKAMHHRIKNNLATISNLLSLQAKTSHSPEASKVLREAVSRVQCIGLLYSKLLETSDYEGVSLKVYLKGIIDSLLEIYPEHKGLSIDLDMDELFLNEKYLFPLGVIIEELITNIFKYGYPDGEKGTVTIRERSQGDQVTLILRDDGRPLPEALSPEGNKGFGMMIVNLLCKQIGGSFSLYNKEGTIREIRFSVK